MYGRGVKCDVCGRVDIVEEPNLPVFDAGFHGWVRVVINNPRDYGWTFREPKFAQMVEARDCCSLDCARKFLSEASATVPQEESEVSA